ncbi:MAG: DegT/DnrJ/EryC1/StrS family aminotransferase, partial [Gemmatimonadota bacterium]
MSVRHQLPVYSPLDARAWLGGLAAMLDPRSCETDVTAWIAERWRSVAVRLTDSGTSALSLAIAASLAGRPAGEGLVALPAYACYDVATAVDGAGVRAVLYDVDPATLGPDWDSLAAALRAGAGAVVVAHLYGVPVDLARVARMAANAGALVIEDAAQGAGAAWQGRPLGAHGSLAVLSFGRGKGITSGGGGALLANDARGAALIEALPPLPEGGSGLGVWARALAQWALARPSLYALPASLPWLGLGETVYHPPHPPRSMPRSALGILARTLALADAEAAVRRRVGARLATVALTANLT